MLNRSTVTKSFNPYGKETATFQTKAYYVTDIGAIVFRHQLTSALSSLSLISSLNVFTFELCYKSIINYDLDIANFLVISPQICYIEVFNLTNPQFNEQIWSAPATSLNRGSTVLIKPMFDCLGQVEF